MKIKKIEVSNFKAISNQIADFDGGEIKYEIL